MTEERKFEVMVLQVNKPILQRSSSRAAGLVDGECRSSLHTRACVGVFGYASLFTTPSLVEPYDSISKPLEERMEAKIGWTRQVMCTQCCMLGNADIILIFKPVVQRKL